MNEIIKHLEEIKRRIVEKDPDDNDKFLRGIWDLAMLALEETNSVELRI